MRLCRIGMVTGSIVGWGGGVAFAVLPAAERTVPVMMLMLATALFCSGALAMRCYQRPLGDAYEIGYERGRRDAIREASKARYALDVTPMKRVKTTVRLPNALV